MKAACAARLALLASLAIPDTLHAGDAKPFSVSLKPGDMHEECVHEEGKVSYPVKRAAMRGDGGTFIAKIGQDYCWMWSARDKAAKLDGKIE